MSITDKTTFTKDQLLSHLKDDDMGIASDIIEKAKRGNKEAIYDVGYTYYCKRDFKRSMLWYQMAAEKDYYSAYFWIGYMYQQGEGVPLDYQIAMEWYLKAASHHDVSAMYHIGTLFENSLGVSEDKNMALEWYLQAGSIYGNQVERLKLEGYSTTKQQKEKTLKQLVKETKAVLTNKMETTLKNKTVKLEKEKTIVKGRRMFSNQLFKQELKTASQKIKELEKENHNLRSSTQQERQDTDEKIKMLEKKNKTLEQKMAAFEKMFKQIDIKTYNDILSGSARSSRSSIKSILRASFDGKSVDDSTYYTASDNDSDEEIDDIITAVFAKDHNDNNDLNYDG